MVAKNAQKSTSESTEVVPVDRWQGVDTWDRVVALAPDLQLAPNVLGDGFVVITKEQLHQSGQEFIILDWAEHLGDKGVYLSIRGITRDSRRFRLSDGSTGIMRQLLDYTKSCIDNDTVPGPIHCGGLHRSDYTNADGIDGTTFYLK